MIEFFFCIGEILPPPPPIPQNIKLQNDEPIYEAVLPRDNLSQLPEVVMEQHQHQHHHQQQQQPLLIENAGHKLRPKSPAITTIRSSSPTIQQRSSSSTTNGVGGNSGGPMSPSSPKHSRPSSRTSSTGGCGSGHPYAEREQRRKYRVEKKLQEMHQLDVTEREKESIRDDIYYDILEFAEGYFNAHERSPEGTIIATLTRKSRKSIDMVPKYEMITYYRGNTIPTSHIHMYDPENIIVACNCFRVSFVSIVDCLFTVQSLQVD